MKKLYFVGFLLFFILSCGGDETTGDNDNESDDVDNYNGSEVITFKDVNLEKCVRNRAQKLEGELTVEDVKYVERLYCDEKGVVVIDGLEKITNLNYLSLKRNDIEDFSLLKDLRLLKTLYIDGNVNVDLETIGKLNNLEDLSVESCDLTELGSITKLVGLRDLNIAANNMETIEEVKNLTGLVWLTVNLNPLKSLNGIDKLTKLEGLSAGSSQLKTIEEVKNLTSLKSLFISTNYLENDDLPVLLNLEKLEKLNIRENCITDFSVIDQMKTNLPDAEILGGVIEAQDLSRCN